jgi:large subunit ribosomal protein L23
MAIFGKKQDAQEPAVKPSKKDAPAVVQEKKKGRSSAVNVLVRPHISEKATDLNALGQYVFVVTTDATKIDIKHAIMTVYGVKPTRVQLMNMGGKRVRYGRTKGSRKKWRKAIVTLPKGKTIQVYEGV